jgi:hypothetical protein
VIGLARNLIYRLKSIMGADPIIGGVSFNHYRPARYFAENISELRQPMFRQHL